MKKKIIFGIYKCTYLLNTFLLSSQVDYYNHNFIFNIFKIVFSFLQINNID